MSFSRRLKALQYPQADVFDVENLKEVQTLVSWLEDTVVRFYKVEDRKALRTFNSEWWKHFATYLTEQGCTRSFDGKDYRSVVDWLLCRAVSFAYQDRAEEYTEIAEEFKEKVRIERKMRELDESTNYNSEEFKAAIVSFAQLLQLPESDNVEDMLRAIARLVRTKFSASAIEEAKKEKKEEDEKQPVISLDDLPLGFNTGDKDVDRAATVLRLLYIADMKELQSKINDLIVAVQNFTADPKADTSLGKVGK